jgi:hypothetical protein
MALVWFLPMKFSFCHTTFTWQVIPLQAMANLFWDPKFSHFFPFSFWWHHGASFWYLCRFLGPLTSIISVSSLGTS